jgi:hypothetical protein
MAHGRRLHTTLHATPAAHPPLSTHRTTQQVAAPARGEPVISNGGLWPLPRAPRRPRVNHHDAVSLTAPQLRQLKRGGGRHQQQRQQHADGEPRQPHHHHNHQQQHHYQQQQQHHHKPQHEAASSSSSSSEGSEADRIAASAQLMSRIKGARTVAALAALFASHSHAADHVHVSCWLSRLPHARDLEYSQWPALDAAGAQLLEQLLGRFLSDLPRHRARQVSNCLWVLGRVARAAAASPEARAATGALVERLLLAPGALLLPQQQRGPRNGSSSSSRSGANSLDAANTAWAMARLQAAFEKGDGADSAPPAWLCDTTWRRLEEACCLQLPSCGPRELAGMLWAFSAARRPAPRLFAAAAPAVLRVGLKLDATHISGIAWAYARQGYRCSISSSSSSTISSSSDPTSSTSSGGGGGDVDSEAAAAGPTPDDVARVFACLSWRAGANAPRFRSQAVAVTLWSLAAAGYAGDAAGAAALAAVAGLRLRKFSGQGLSMLAHAASGLGLLRQRPGLRGALQREVLFKMEEMRPLGIARVLHMLAQERRRGRSHSSDAASDGSGGGGGSGGSSSAERQRQGELFQEVQRQLLRERRRHARRGQLRTLGLEEDEGEDEEEQQQLAGDATAAVVLDALAAVCATDSLPPPDALRRQSEPPCGRLFMRELQRRAAAQLPDTAPRTLLRQLAALAELRECEPRLLRGMAAAAAAAPAGVFGGPAAVAELLHGFAVLQQPCRPLWRAMAPGLVAAEGAAALSPEQLALVAWAAATSPGAAADRQLAPVLDGLLVAAWQRASGLDAAFLGRLVWATVVMLQQQQSADGSSGSSSGSFRDELAGRAARLLPQLLAAAASGGGGDPAAPLSIERRAELLHAAHLLGAMRPRQQQHADASSAPPPPSAADRHALRLAEEVFNDLGARAVPPRALLMLLACHGGGRAGSVTGTSGGINAARPPLQDPKLAATYAQEALTHLRAFGLQGSIELLQLLAAAPGAAAGVAGAELARGAAQQLRARLPAATGGQLAAAVVVASRLQGAGGEGGGSSGGGGVVRAAGKLLLTRTGECSADELLEAAAAVAGVAGRSSSSGSRGGSGGSYASDMIPLASALLARLELAQQQQHAEAAAALRRAQRSLALLQQGGAAGAAAAALCGQLRSHLAEAVRCMRAAEAPAVVPALVVDAAVV